MGTVDNNSLITTNRSEGDASVPIKENIFELGTEETPVFDANGRVVGLLERESILPPPHPKSPAAGQEPPAVLP